MLRMKHRRLFLVLLAAVIGVSDQVNPSPRSAAPLPSGSRNTFRTSPDARVAIGNIPIHFVPNQGQADSSVRFVGQGFGATLLLTDDAALVVDVASRMVLRQSIVGGRRPLQLEASHPLGGKTHFFLDRGQHQWQTDVAQFARVAYRDVYPGIDLVYYGNAGTLEYDWIVAPGADPGSIALAMEGADRARLGDGGDLLLDTATGTMRFARPVVYQRIGTIRRTVDAEYVLDEPNRVRYAVGAYDPALPLVIDPTLHYSTYLGGNGLDVGMDVALDTQGNVYVTGETRSPNFPVKNQIGGTAGDRDGFVAKLDPTLHTLIYSTYLGGVGADRGASIAVDPQGNAYVTGFTYSPNFPVTSGALDTSCGTDGACNPTTSGDRVIPRSDAFIVKLDPAGKLVYGTYLGDSEPDSGAGIAVDGLGSAYVTGWTQSRYFPSTPGVFQKECTGLGSTVRSCSQDAFVTRINGAGNDLVYSTLLGGSSRDDGLAIALDVNTGIASAAYVTGSTQSRDFPTTPGAFGQAFSGGWTDAFVTKLDASGHALAYSSYLGGSDYDDARGIAVDRDRSAYVIGQTASANFPTAGAIDASCGTDGDCNAIGNQRYVDAFVSKFNAQGSGLAYSTYLGGAFIEFVGDIAVDGALNAWVTGQTTSADFPVVNGVLGVSAGAEGFVAQLNPGGNGLLYSTYLSGAGSDSGHGIVVDPQGNAHVTGNAGPGFATTSGAFQTNYPGTSIGTGVAFVVRIGEGAAPPLPWLWWLWAIAVILLMMAAAAFILRRRPQSRGEVATDSKSRR